MNYMTKFILILLTFAVGAAAIDWGQSNASGLVSGIGGVILLIAIVWVLTDLILYLRSADRPGKG